jgi:hypothetical protein
MDSPRTGPTSRLQYPLTTAPCSGLLDALRQCMHSEHRSFRVLSRTRVTHSCFKARLIAARRHRVFKLKIGRGELEADVAHAAAIKHALGDGIGVIVDVNQAWDEVTATRGIAALEAAGIDLVEQPIARRHRRGMARLAARFAIPIMADESLDGPEDAFELASDARPTSSRSRSPRQEGRSQPYARRPWPRLPVSPCTAAPCWKALWAALRRHTPLLPVCA